MRTWAIPDEFMRIFGVFARSNTTIVAYDFDVWADYLLNLSLRIFKEPYSAFLGRNDFIQQCLEILPFWFFRFVGSKFFESRCPTYLPFVGDVNHSSFLRILLTPYPLFYKSYESFILFLRISLTSATLLKFFKIYINFLVNFVFEL